MQGTSSSQFRHGSAIIEHYRFSTIYNVSLMSIFTLLAGFEAIFTDAFLSMHLSDMLSSAAAGDRLLSTGERATLYFTLHEVPCPSDIASIATATIAAQEYNVYCLIYYCYSRATN
jgi:hypothetical protein